MNPEIDMNPPEVEVSTEYLNSYFILHLTPFFPLYNYTDNQKKVLYMADKFLSDIINNLKEKTRKKMFKTLRGNVIKISYDGSDSFIYNIPKTSCPRTNRYIRKIIMYILSNDEFEVNGENLNIRVLEEDEEVINARNDLIFSMTGQDLEYEKENWEIKFSM
jgi:hypothetical protein